MKGFFEFIKKQGVVGLAVGFILGSAVAKLVASLVGDIVNPLLGIALGTVKGLETFTVNFSGANLMVGHFIAALIDFIVIALVVYIGVKAFGFDKKKA